jgi:hypothetical protein
MGAALLVQPLIAVAVNAIITRPFGRFNIDPLPFLPAKARLVRVPKQSFHKRSVKEIGSGTAFGPVRSFRQ